MRSHRRLLILLSLGVITATARGQQQSPAFCDLSLLVAAEYPCTWPQGWPIFQINPYLRIGPTSAYNSEILTVDPNTGTQLDVPPHSIPRPGSGLPNSGPTGAMFSDKVPAWQYGGEACVIDVTDLIASAPRGHSALIKKERVVAWERKYRPLHAGDVVIFRSGYSDKYYKPLPAGRRFLAEPLENKTPAWPDPDPPCMEYLATRNVMHVVVDSPSMGPIPDLQEPTHIAGLKHGMIFTEGATNLTDLPPTGAFYCAVGPRHADCAGSETRALAILDKPLAERLIDSVKHRRVIDLSPVLHPDLPLSLSGVAVGAHRQPYVKGTFGYNPNVDAAFNTHIMDSHTGTHLVPPSYALPPKGFDNGSYAPHVRRWLADYERTFGPRGTSSVTTEQVPLEQTCGPARVIDVRHLVGTTSTEDRPISPVITPTHIAAYEKQTGALRPNEVVIFFTGHTDRHLKRMSDGGSAMMDDPFSGKSEGWPAPGPETIRHLDGKGIRCVATDAPTLGGVDPPQALLTYWTLGTAGMVGVEFLIDLEKVPDNAYFLFAAPKIRGGHGGVGRAIALH